MGFFDSLGQAVGRNIVLTNDEGTGLADRIWAKVWPWAEKKLDEQVDKYLPIIIEKLMTIMPTLLTSAVKVAVEKAFEMLPDMPNIELPAVGEMTGEVVNKVIDADPDIPGLSNIIDVSEMFKNWRDTFIKPR